jgi:hypothetical protein
VNLKKLEMIAKGAGEQWYYNITETAKLLGCTRQYAAVFLNKQGVQHYRITGRAKSYFLDDIITAVEKTRWKN